MRIKVFQKIIDIIRGKRFFNFVGKNNKIIILDKSKFNMIKLFALSKIKINGNNNTIIFRGDFKLKNYFNILFKLDLRIKGNNNLFDLEFPIRVSNVVIGLKNNNNIFKIRKSKYPIRNARIGVATGCEINIGENCQLGNGDLYVMVGNAYNNKNKLVLGDNVLIAKDAIIRTCDGHTLINPISKKALNEPEDVIIGDNVWITSRCTILKGTQLPSNCVVGACSLVNKKFTEENVIIAGSPAKIIKRNIGWDPRNFNNYMEDLEEGVYG